VQIAISRIPSMSATMALSLAVAEVRSKSETESRFNITISKHNSELRGSLLTRALRKSKLELSAWSRESKSGVRRSPSKWMSTQIKSNPQSPDP